MSGVCHYERRRWTWCEPSTSNPLRGREQRRGTVAERSGGSREAGRRTGSLPLRRAEAAKPFYRPSSQRRGLTFIVTSATAGSAQKPLARYFVLSIRQFLATAYRRNF